MNNIGFLLTISGFLIWGFVPLYWKLIKDIPAFEIVNHRIVWTAIILSLFLLYRKKTKALISIFKNQRKLLSLLLSTICISANWFIFVWAVNANHILETSLGYYINPLFNILFGATVLKEKFSKPQIMAVFLAFIGVGFLTINHGSVPWISLSLAFSFGLYGLIRKIIPVDSDVGLTAESLILFLPALIYLGFMNPTTHFNESSFNALMLMGGGLVTTIPLLLYLEGVRRIPYSTVGILQFITPTTTFLIAVFLYKEPFDLEHFISFCFIWLAVIIYILDIFAKRISK